MVTSATWFQRNLHMVVGMMRGRVNTCWTQRKDGSYVPKQNYKSQETAEKSARRLQEKWGKPFDAYQCWFCKGWHIGGAANLTFGRFLSIMWVWLLGKKRAGNKHRLKARITSPMNCERCNKVTDITIVSMFNTQTICMDCSTEEEKRPDYADAKKADEEAIRTGNYNFKGIGFVLLLALMSLSLAACAGKPSNDAVKDAVLTYYSRKHFTASGTQLTKPTILNVSVVSVDDPYEIGATGDVRMNGSPVYDHFQHSKVVVFLSGYCHHIGYDSGTMLDTEESPERWDKTMSFQLLKSSDGWSVEEVNGQDAESPSTEKYVCD